MTVKDLIKLVDFKCVVDKILFVTHVLMLIPYNKNHVENFDNFHSLLMKLGANFRSEPVKPESGSWKRWLILFFYFLLNAEMAFQVEFLKFSLMNTIILRCLCSSQYQE